ncbi:Holliday junction branch migration protein RuvA [Candidatus Woesebacteria bacterium]|nr:Holliday junction branch migration protein RuvA [Candidatus Woesebacteria bacterium]
MIGMLTGVVILQNQEVIIDVSGVGYQVAVTTSTTAKLINGQTVTLHIFTHVKEDALELFGFPELAEKKLFQLLLSVSGVGPRTALAISDLGASTITQAVQEANVSRFSTVPRVGKKLAQKIIIELKSKLGSLQELELGGVTDPNQQEVVAALLSLGFEEQQIYRVVREIDASLGVAEQAKLAMKQLAQQFL